MSDFVIPFESLGRHDVEQVGGKNSSLGEMISSLSSLGVRVPTGVATTAAAYREFLKQNGLADRIDSTLSDLDVDNVEALRTAGRDIRGWIMKTPLPERLVAELKTAYDKLIKDAPDTSFAVRSSATAEDLPEASFAGQQETLLNVSGFDEIVKAMHEVFASLFNDRAIAYRVHQGFEHRHVALSAGIQHMIRSDTGTSGVMFTLDTDSGFRDVVFITAAYGLGETVVQGAVNPDEFLVFKPTLKKGLNAILRRQLGSKAIKMIYTSDGQEGTTTTVDVPVADRNVFCLTNDDIEQLARQAVIIEEHYGLPMDIEWGKDGTTGEIYVLQARPETVQSRSHGQVIERFQLKTSGNILATGRSIGHKIGAGPARVISSPEEMHRVRENDVIVTDMTDPDWEPVMKKSAAIVTNRGGRTCHAAIIARELGIPAVVGCGDATKRIADGANVTVSCAEGDDGFIYEGDLDFERREISLDTLPDIPVKLMMNVGNPDRALDFASMPHHGVGLARLEFIINRMIGVHPNALLEFDKLPDALKQEISGYTAGYDDPVNFFVDRLAEGISLIAAAFYPEPVIVRLSDFKTNEYANLVGGDRYEPHEENPMLGFRGASRYVDPTFSECFALECKAMRKVRNEMGLTNVEVMIPFVRTVAEAVDALEAMKKNGLERGKDGLRVIMMCELPSNALLANEFLDHFDGFSIGSNDLTQLTLGLDRDSALVARLFDERDAAVKKLLEMAIRACRERGKYIGICGQGPSDHPDLAKWLLDQKIESMSLNPDTILDTWLYLGGKQIA